MKTIAAIDIGSNAMRLVVGRVDKSARIEVLAARRAAVRLGADVFRTGSISSTRIEQAVAAFIEFEAVIRANQVTLVRAVATSALRDARNSSVLLDRIFRATGIAVEVISGDEEARLIFLAVSRATPLGRGSSLLLDIGGGSVELSLVQRGHRVFSESMNIGTVRLLEMVRGRPGRQVFLHRFLRRYSTRIHQQISRTAGIHHVKRVIGTGGNIECLPDLKVRILDKKAGHSIRKKEIAHIMRQLEGMTVQQRVKHLGLRPDRADVIVPAMALVLSVLDAAQADTLIIPKTGLRDGVLWDSHARASTPHGTTNLLRQFEDSRLHALEFGRRFSFDEQHALHVVKLALQVFDQTARMHRLPKEVRMILEIAGLLHDIGYIVESTHHHKHSAYLIRESQFVGLTERERSMVALIAHYHRGDTPGNRDAAFKALSRSDRTAVKVCAAIIRLVEEFDREHLQRVSRVKAMRTGSCLTIKLSAKTKLLVERVGAQTRKKPLERALGMEIQVS